MFSEIVYRPIVNKTKYHSFSISAQHSACVVDHSSTVDCPASVSIQIYNSTSPVAVCIANAFHSKRLPPAAHAGLCPSCFSRFMASFRPGTRTNTNPNISIHLCSAQHSFLHGVVRLPSQIGNKIRAKLVLQINLPNFSTSPTFSLFMHSFMKNKPSTPNRGGNCRKKNPFSKWSPNLTKSSSFV